MQTGQVIVVGAGPSGLLLTLLLSQSGIPVTLLEQTSGLDTNTRASHYTPESCFEFDRAGVLDIIRSEGFSPNGVSWRKLDEHKTRLVKLQNPDPTPEEENQLPHRHRMVCLPLHRLGKILEDAVEQQPTATVHYGYKVTDINQAESKAQVTVAISDPNGNPETEVLEADYIVGCDGANSTVRRKLFGEMVYPGFTHDQQIVATNVHYDFSPYGYDDSQFFVHPEHWHMVARIQTDGLYRVTYGEVGGLTYDQLKERQPQKFMDILPGNPTPDKYKLVNFSPYKVHQRCVDKMRVGRFLLAADAAHLCNPFGGLGLTGGIADVGSLYDSLVGIHTGQADESILDIYDTERRRIWHEIINPNSTQNMRRLFTLDADTAVEKDPFLNMLRKIQDGEAPPANPGLMSLRYDMTQHYKAAWRNA
ncbi:FAD/NAD(P)-binding domain-containing protein [Diplogelasinospora grovesii]|uniref:FAD/NAD(P)-binding domain-containing protein n=1 Tax=Diplogelasinospora grovesii TaxID=303347 RepID=A0AAN6N5P4_9PEZI|nr:FAD/NAD(P)-binding domain-containing protein [Diplogelasinospora grovesii]